MKIEIIKFDTGIQILLDSHHLGYIICTGHKKPILKSHKWLWVALNSNQINKYTQIKLNYMLMDLFSPFTCLLNK